METKKILYVDDREPPRLAELLSEQCPIPIEIAHLVTGDFLCDNVVFERKTASDFANSVMSRENGNGNKMDGRIFLQAERLAKFPHRYILVSGTFEEVVAKIHRHSALGALARLLVNGISVCFGLGNDEDLVYLVLKVLEKHGKLKMITKKKIKIIEPTESFVGII